MPLEDQPDFPEVTARPCDQIPRPSGLLGVDSPRALEMLEELDDAVFAALQGCQTALERTRQLWPQALEAIDWELIDESREQYLRFAVETTQRLQEAEIRTPERSVAALEVISLLAR